MLCISSNKTTEENQSSFDAPNGVTHKKKPHHYKINICMAPLRI